MGLETARQLDEDTDQMSRLNTSEKTDPNKERMDSLKRIKNEKSTIKEESAKLEKQRTKTEIENKIFKNIQQRPEDEDSPLMELSDLAEWRQKIDQTDKITDPIARTAAIKEVKRKFEEELKNKEKTRKKAKEEDVEDEKKLPEDHKSLLALQKLFDKTCDDNKDIIGLKQVPQFKAWFAKERKENPTKKHLKEQIKKLTGEIRDEDGLFPRREEFAKLTRLFQKNNISSPLESPWIKMEGLKERQEFRKNAEEFQDLLDTSNDQLYTKEAKTKIMREVLMAKYPAAQQQLISQLKKVSEKESEGFVHLNASKTVNGITIRQVSESSFKLITNYYKNVGSLKERQMLSSHWKEAAEKEGELFEELGEIFKDDKKSFALATESFQQLSFANKQKAVEKHRKDVENGREKDEMRKEMVITAAGTKIDDAAREKIFSEKTQERYKEFFENENNFKNPKTGKVGDLETLEKAYKTLTSPSVQEKNKNIAAYKFRRDEYAKKVKKLEETNPDLEKDDLEEWQDKYDKEGWTKREKVDQDLTAEITKQKIERKKIEKAEKLSDIDQKDKEKAKEKNPAKTEQMIQAIEMMAKNKPKKALDNLLLYMSASGDRSDEILWLLEKVSQETREKGQKEEEEKEFEEEVTAEMEEISHTDNILHREREEVHVKGVVVKGVEQSVRRHHQELEAEDRTYQDAMDAADNDSERELTEDFYDEFSDGTTAIGEEGTGTEIEDVQLSRDLYNQDLTDEEFHDLYRNISRQQDKVFTTHEGLDDVDVVDESEDILEVERSKRNLEAQQGQLAEEMAEKAVDNLETEQKGQVIEESPFSEEAKKIAAIRKAKDLLKKDQEKRLEKRD